MGRSDLGARTWGRSNRIPYEQLLAINISHTYLNNFQWFSDDETKLAEKDTELRENLKADEETEYETAQETAQRIEDEEIEAPKKKTANRRVGVWGCGCFTYKYMYASVVFFFFSFF